VGIFPLHKAGILMTVYIPLIHYCGHLTSEMLLLLVELLFLLTT